MSLKTMAYKRRGLTASELQQAIFDRFEILEEDGAAFLRAKSAPTASRNATRITEELRPLPSSYYPPRPAAAAHPSKAKRQRVPEPVTTNHECKDDEMDNEMEEEGGARAKPPGACARCKNLKVKCEFKTETEPCKRCFNGGNDCVTPGRRKRRTPPKREHLLNQIREQAAEIQKLMAQLEQTNARQHAKPPNSATTDTFPLTPSSSSHNELPSPVLSPSSSAPSSYFPSSSGDTKAESENNRAVEDWIVKARDSLAEFDGFIGIGGAGMTKILSTSLGPRTYPPGLMITEGEGLMIVVRGQGQALRMKLRPLIPPGEVTTLRAPTHRRPRDFPDITVLTTQSPTPPLYLLVFHLLPAHPRT
ncbi:Zn(2)-C6 fungal-type domain-containing protein [Mycena sanguinolenta]|uniref:Zn(2)-C6 fungal-type domain-containing protein n=1 Tax=Mycena sanguinolenta TaxID=230812 RepID=A0A8H6Z8T5_9AGAR|nr:Zn(2)-C6 fungal-type domain-containing protein [Mycena sanguinolenta]